MKRKDLNQLLISIKEKLFLNDNGKRSNFLNLLDGSRFEEINETTSTIVISVPVKYSAAILNANEFKNEFTDVADNVLNSNYEVVFVSKDEWEKRDTDKTTQELKLMKVQSDNLNPDYTLDNFIASGKNNSVKQAALAVAMKPGEWTPSFIYGGSGLGKTHILQGIGNKIKEEKSNYSIKYLETKDFSDLLYDSNINTKKVKALTEELLSYDVLLVDDIQMLETLPKGREVFFGILSNFITQKKQIVISSDKYPEEMKNFEERFITRFKSGTGALSLAPPDMGTAKKIFMQKAAMKDGTQNFKFTDAALDFIATNFGSNVRELEGCLGRIMFWSISSNKDTDTEYTVEDMLDIFEGITTSRGLTLNHIASVVAKQYQVSLSDVLGKSRKAEIALPRHIAVYFSRILLELPVMDIGRYFGRDHSTILTSVKKIEAEILENQELSRVIYDLRKKIISKT